MSGFADRETYVAHVRSRRPIVPKDAYILELCAHRSVLDIGCIDHSYEVALELGEDWLHARIATVADSVVGLDLLEADAAELNGRGYDIVIADAEDFDLGREFDVIVAGDLIEHLSNPGRFLEAAARHMGPDSRLVVTTPNPFNVEQFFQAAFRNQVMVNPEHAAWLDPEVMYELVSRSSLRIVGFEWVDTRFRFVLRGGRVLRRIVNPLASEIMRRRPLLRRDYAVTLALR